MKISGTSHLSADRDTVWQALNDPSVLVRTIPGCQKLEALGDDAYAMTISAGVASIKGVYDGKVRLSDQQQPGSFRLHAQGAGAPGTIGADVLVTLSDGTDGGTDLSYDADATVGGMIGGVGQRMLTGVSKRMAGEFFGNVNAVLAGPSAVAEMPAPGLPAGGGAGIQPGSFVAGRPGPSTPTPPPAVRPGAGAATATAGQVFTAPPPTGSTNGDFLKGVAVGAGLVLAGVIVGGLFGRRSR